MPSLFAELSKALSRCSATAHSTSLTLQKAQPNRPAWIVPVEVNQDDALPGPQLRVTTCDRHRHRRRDDRRQHMVGAVALGAMRMPVAVVTWQQPLQRVDQVVVGAGAGLDDGDTGRRVRHEHVAQTVAVAEAEPAHRIREIDDSATGGVHFQHIGMHPDKPTVERLGPANLLGGPMRARHTIAGGQGQEEGNWWTGGATGALPRTKG